MRKFGKDSPEFFAFQIEGSEKTYKIPLAASMTIRQIKAFEKTEGGLYEQIEWLKEFMGDVVEDLTASEASAILHAWAEASKEQGATAGES